MRFEHTRVAGHFFTFLQNNDISRHDVLIRDDKLHTIAKHRRVRPDEVFERQKGVLRLAFLNRAYDGVKNQYEENDERIGEFPEEKYDGACGKKHRDQRAVELAEKNKRERVGFRFRYLIGSEAREPRLRFRLSKAGSDVGVELLFKFRERFRVPCAYHAVYAFSALNILR